MSSRRKDSDGIVAMERGEAVLVAQDGIYPEGLVFEVQLEGLPSGFEPTREEMVNSYQEARKKGYIVGAEDVATSIIKRTMDVHELLVREGRLDVENDPSLDGVDFGFFRVVTAYNTVNRYIGRK